MVSDKKVTHSQNLNVANLYTVADMEDYVQALNPNVSFLLLSTTNQFSAIRRQWHATLCRIAPNKKS